MTSITFWYNMTAINATSALSFAQSVNSVFMFNQLGLMLVIILWLISFISMNWYMPMRVVNNFTVSSFFISVVAMLLTIVHLLHWSVPLICFGMFVLGTIGLLLRK